MFCSKLSKIIYNSYKLLFLTYFLFISNKKFVIKKKDYPNSYIKIPTKYYLIIFSNIYRFN